MTDAAPALDAIEHSTGTMPRASIIWLHGLGADGNDFVPFVDQVDLAPCGPVRWVFPHAPVRPVTINGGFPMRAWFDIRSLDRPGREDEAGLRASRSAVDALIARERARGVPASRIVLGGFSQGCAMTLLAGVRHPERLGGLVGLSGFLPLATSTASERDPANRDVPIFLAHGTQDPVVPYAAGVASRDLLMGLGHRVQWHEYPMPHSVCMEEVADLARFLSTVLGQPR